MTTVSDRLKEFEQVHGSVLELKGLYDGGYEGELVSIPDLVRGSIKKFAEGIPQSQILKYKPMIEYLESLSPPYRSILIFDDDGSKEVDECLVPRALGGPITA